MHLLTLALTQNIAVFGCKPKLMLAGCDDAARQHASVQQYVHQNVATGVLMHFLAAKQLETGSSEHADVADLLVAQLLLGLCSAHCTPCPMACTAKGLLHGPLGAHQHIAACAHGPPNQHWLPTLLISAPQHKSRSEWSYINTKMISEVSNRPLECAYPQYAHQRAQTVVRDIAEAIRQV